MIPGVASNSYLTFLIGNDKFAVRVEHVQEVLEVGQITKLPHAPVYILGIINLRGKILPLIDTRQKLGLPSVALTHNNRILVLDISDTPEKQTLVGVTVDIAREVVTLGAQDIQDPEHIQYNNTTPLSGIVNNEGDITMILNVSALFPIGEITSFDLPTN
jgi:purine-binding chemotaxis protein CheW